jgi:two-component system chemotaxis response regulator CheB
MTKLLIVDDSALMIHQLTILFQAEGDFDIRQARNGAEAMRENREFQPDVVILDIHMPELEGETVLSLILAERPVPVVMVCSLTEQEALATFEALHQGAVDYISNPMGAIAQSTDPIGGELLARVRGAAQARPRGPGSRVCPLCGMVRRMQPERRAAIAAGDEHRGNGDGLLVMGASTGGPRALEIVLSGLPADFPWPVVVAQHMPAAFTKVFAERLDACCALQVVEAASALPVEAGRVYIGRGGSDLLLAKRAGRLTVLAAPKNPNYPWHPSVELLGRSVLEHYDPRHTTAVLLTGMGHDGSEAFAQIKLRGGRTIAESEDSAVAYEMPAELVRRGGASLVLAAEAVPGQLATWAGR